MLMHIVRAFDLALTVKDSHTPPPAPNDGFKALNGLRVLSMVRVIDGA